MTGDGDRLNVQLITKLITRNETWVYGREVETKVQSSQLVWKMSPRQKKKKKKDYSTKLWYSPSHVYNVSACSKLVIFLYLTQETDRLAGSYLTKTAEEYLNSTYCNL